MIDNILVSDAFAQAADVANSSSQEPGFASFIPLILIFGIFYFLIIRPQSKKYKEHQTMVDALKIGAKVITNGGIVGFVREIDNNEGIIDLEISEGVKIKILKNYVSNVVTEEKKESKKSKKGKKTS